MRQNGFVALASLAAFLVSCSVVLGLHEPTVDETVGDGGGGGDGSGGPCGHDCLGGACTMGQCQPVVLAKNQAGPLLIAEYGPRVYWTNVVGNNVESADKVDAAIALVADDNVVDGPFGIKADDSGVYIASAGSTTANVIQCNLQSCAAEKVLFNGGNSNSDLALSGGYVYWMQAFGDEVDRIPTTGGNYDKLATVDVNNNDALLSRIATDGQFIYWSETENDAIFRKPIDTGTATKIYALASSSRPGALVLDGDTLYFAKFGNGIDNAVGSVSSGSSDGTSGEQPLATAQHSPWGLASDATYLYWTAEGDFDSMGNVITGSGSIMRCAKSGCNLTPDVLATGLTDARGIAVDDTAIYYVTFETGNGDGKVWRLAK